METQKASKGELYLQTIYVLAAIFGLVYVGNLTISLVTGNLQSLTHSPERTALLCLLSGFSLANLCRNRSAIFWKTVDLIWVLTFVPSLVMTVVLHLEAEKMADVMSLADDQVASNIRTLDQWKELRSLYCDSKSTEKTSPALDDISSMCEVLVYSEKVVGSFGNSRDKILRTAEKLMRNQPVEVIAPDISGKLGYISLNIINGRFDYRLFESIIGERLSHEIRVATKLVSKFSQLEVDLSNFDGLVYWEVEKFDRLVNKLVNETDWFRVWTVSTAEYQRTIFEAMFPDANGNDFLSDKRIVADQFEKDLSYARALVQSIDSVSRFMRDNEKFMNNYKRALSSRASQHKFLPLILACFIFPFRVGKSIFEIAAQRENDNASLSS